jgi:hypothetical protein
MFEYFIILTNYSCALHLMTKQLKLVIVSKVSLKLVILNLSLKECLPSHFKARHQKCLTFNNHDGYILKMGGQISLYIGHFDIPWSQSIQMIF